MAKKKKKTNLPKKEIEEVSKDTIEIKDNSIEKIIENEIKMKKEKEKEKEKDNSKKVTKVKEVKHINQTIKHPFIHTFLVLVLVVSLGYFIINLFYSDDSINTLINSLLLMIFTLLFVSTSITTNRKNKNGFLLGGLILLLYFTFGITSNLGIVKIDNKRVINFSGKSLTEVIKWAEKNKINIIQDYEYSDMIDEYFIISQDVKEGTKLKGLKSITVSVSEGANPYKEIIIPNMVSWDTERVLEFVKDNHLSNVDVEFVQSSKQADTVIEQSISGNLKRNDNLKLVFSYGEELGYNEVKLIDFTGKSKFEIIFYMKQYHLNYEFNDDFSSDIKNGLAIKQSVKPGDMVKVNGDKVIVTLSKGPKIIVPKLTSMSMTDITEWVIKNKLKLEFKDQYDDTVKENNVISANYKENEIISENTLIKVVISRGKLTMPKFDTYNDFRDWAEKYSINFVEEHEFSNDVAAGNVIRYSYDTGATLKNNDSITVVISAGKEMEVPNVVGNSKAQASTKMNNAGLGYNFVYSYSNSVPQGNIINQSISGGSKVAQGTTVTLTVSNGPRPVSTPTTPSTPSTPATPAPVCNPVSITIQSSLNGSSVGVTCNNYKNSYPNAKISCVGRPSSVGTTGMVHPDTAQKRVLSGTTCDTFTIVIIEN